METINSQFVMTILEKHSSYMWVRGISGYFVFDAKVYYTGSKNSIRKGRISKLFIWRNAARQGGSRWIAIYDCGWDIHPQKDYRQFVEYIVGLLEVLPPPEELALSRKEDSC